MKREEEDFYNSEYLLKLNGVKVYNGAKWRKICLQSPTVIILPLDVLYFELILFTEID